MKSKPATPPHYTDSDDKKGESNSEKKQTYKLTGIQRERERERAHIAEGADRDLQKI